jgi:hypothetical protein
VEDVVEGASAGCAAVFGASDELERAGVPLLTANAVPGTPGLPSLVAYLDDGPVLTF